MNPNRNAPILATRRHEVEVAIFALYLSKQMCTKMFEGSTGA